MTEAFLCGQIIIGFIHSELRKQSILIVNGQQSIYVFVLENFDFIVRFGHGSLELYK